MREAITGHQWSLVAITSVRGAYGVARLMREAISRLMREAISRLMREAISRLMREAISQDKSQTEAISGNHPHRSPR